MLHINNSSKTLPLLKKDRIKIAIRHPINQLFAQWLTELREQTRGISNVSLTYSHALDSLRKYPRALHSGAEAKILHSFGDKICAELDKRLEVFRSSFGEPTYELVFGESIPGIRKDVFTAIPASSATHAAPVDEPTSSSAGAAVDSVNPSKCYVPKPGTAPYALLLTLYDHELLTAGTDTDNALSKAALIEKAQPKCNTSFTKAQAGSYFNAWHSMTTLINKNLVLKEMRKQRAFFRLSCEGRQCAKALLNTVVNKTTSDLLVTTQKRGTKRKAPESRVYTDKVATGASLAPSSVQDANLNNDISNEAQLNEDNARISNSTTATKDYMLSYVYIDDDGQETSLKDKAVVSFDEESFAASYLVKARENDLKASTKRFVIDLTRSANCGFVYAFLAESSAADVAPGLSHFEIDASKLSPLKCVKPLSLPTVVTVSQTKMANMESTIRSHAPDIRSLQPSFVLEPFSYEIELIVDCQEVATSSKSKSRVAQELLVAQLESAGVRFERRRLSVGDFLWIAKDKRNTGKEVVLDFIVERKRMDDLWQSIVDNRFHEQKFRLKRCGLRRPTYLVEDYGSLDSIGHTDNLLQAMFNTQIQDGFYVVRARDGLNGSVRYLKCMTHKLRCQFQKQRMLCCDHGSVTKFKDINPLAADELPLLSFEEFQSVSNKQRAIPMSELFAKQLTVLSGITPEKALAIARAFPSAACLIEALEKAPDPGRLFSSVKVGSDERSRALGPALSGTVASFFHSKQPFVR